MVPLVERLHVPSQNPSSVKSEDIKRDTLDENYYSPCANSFFLEAHFLAFQILPNIQSSRFTIQVNIMLYSELMMMMTVLSQGYESLGYLRQVSFREEGVTALLTANISKCFDEYCRLKGLSQDFIDRAVIMHQSTVTTSSRKRCCGGIIDIALFLRSYQSDTDFAYSPSKTLFPLLFIEFTKTSTKTVEEKFPQASTYANHLFLLMEADERNFWMPLLGIIMSETEMRFRVYSPSLVSNKWKIAEVDIMACSMPTENLQRLMHVMVGWTEYCFKLLFAKEGRQHVSNKYLALRKHSNTAIDKEVGKVYKCFDYRIISQRLHVTPSDRRDPVQYFNSDLRNVTMEVDWTSSVNSEDSLQIISYDLVPGVHYPSFVGHFTQVLKKLIQLHEGSSSSIVHGDLRFSNIVFSEPGEDRPVVSTIIDFDYSGLAGEKAYPPRFNTSINDGFRHPDARPKELLQVSHDIAAVHWMFEQYRPAREELRRTWSSALQDLISRDIHAAVESLIPYEKEELVAINVTSEREITSRMVDSGSPQTL